MKEQYYAAYESKSKKELCLGVWKSMAELARAMRISPKSAWSNLYRSRKERNYVSSPIIVRRIITEE